MNIYEESVKLWGESFQLLMVIEECSELINAICKLYRNRVTTTDVIEEGVDVQLMINQLKVMLKDDETWNAKMKEKVARLEERINAS